MLIFKAKIRNDIRNNAATEPISRVLSWTAIYLGRALPPLLDAT